MRKVAPKTLRIGLLLSAATEYGRGVLRGVADFGEDHPHCVFRVAEPDPAGIATLSKWRPDGLLVMLNRKKLLPRVLAIGRPAVYVCKPVGIADPICVQSDDAAVGRLGAEHLLELNAAAYGFVGLAEGEYVQARSEGFQRTIEDAGATCAIFQPLGQSPQRRDLETLAQWLKRSPKPFSVMACNDICGRLVLETVRQAGLRVPDDVSVVGVDNEDPLSRLVWPGLSSVSLATDEIGYKAAAFLHRSLSGAAPARPLVLVPPLGVVARGSTRQLAHADPVLSKVLSAINESISTPRSVDELARVGGISRVSLERRFRRVLDRTPLQEMRRVRIERARQLLNATDLPLKAVADHCGYAAASRLIEAFQAETGLSPSAHRANTLRRRRRQGAAKP